jgi:hypothetical protein
MRARRPKRTAQALLDDVLNAKRRSVLFGWVFVQSLDVPCAEVRSLIAGSRELVAADYDVAADLTVMT